MGGDDRTRHRFVVWRIKYWWPANHSKTSHSAQKEGDWQFRSLKDGRHARYGLDSRRFAASRESFTIRHEGSPGAHFSVQFKRDIPSEIAKLFCVGAALVSESDWSNAEV
jgi:hypothetical protein